MITRKYITALLLILAICAGLGVERTMAQSAGAFSRLGFGARGIAMGNAVGADGSGDASPYYNPALAPAIQRQSLQATVGILSFDRSIQFLQLSSPLRQRAGVAAGLIHASVDNIDGRDNSGFHTGNYSIDEYAGFLAFGVNFSESVSGGIGLQFFRTDLFDGLDPAVTIGIDIGFLVRASETLSFSLVLDDLLARYRWDSGSVNGSGGKKTTDNFPTRLRLGVMNTQLYDRLKIVAEYEARFRSVESLSSEVVILGDEPVQRANTSDLVLYETRIRAGVEYQLHDQFVVRSGLEQLGDEVFGGVRPAAGFMVEQNVGNMDARFEYAFSLESPAAGTMHMLTLLLFL